MSWQNLIRDWLRRTAEQRLREAMAAAAQSQGERAGAASKATTQPAAGTVQAAQVGLVLSEHREAVGVIDRLDGLLTIEADRVQVFEGALGGRRLALVVCGPSPGAAAEAAEVLIDGHHPKWLISAGFCTGIVTELAVGDIVLADHVVSAEGTLPALILPGTAWRTGRLLSSASVGRDIEQRKQLAEQFSAVAADSHSYAVVEAARRRGVPCAALCVVRHALSQLSAQDVDRLRRKQSLSRRVGLLTGLLLNRPGSLKALWSEKEQDLVSADCLADGVAELMEKLGTHPASREADIHAPRETHGIKEDV